MISLIVISKDEPQLAHTLTALSESIADVQPGLETEIIVIDASEGRLAEISRRHPNVQWIDFTPPVGVRVSIPHQRNVGLKAARGEIIVFTDSGCVPEPGWLRQLIQPILDGVEQITSGPAFTRSTVYSLPRGISPPMYVDEAPTINLAFRKELVEQVGLFDERFEYGSDVDFTWRLVDAGVRIRYVATAAVNHDWGSLLRQLKRSRQYGRARIRLYGKHPHRLRHVLDKDPVPFVYALYLIGLPLAIRFHSYLLLPLIPLWRARSRPFPIRVVISHLAEGVGSLEEIVGALGSHVGQ